MGLTIHYSGKIDRIETIPLFVDELIDIANAMHWSAQAINMDEAEPMFRGVIVNPTGDCEPLCFIYDREGRLRPLMDLLTEPSEPHEYSYFVATKTQFTTIETHAWIIGLLHYLKKRYIANLKVKDEGDYWETGNIDNLRKKKEYLQGMINTIADELSEIEAIPEKTSIDAIIKKIEAIFETRVSWKPPPLT
jgi:hypothetical protein